MRPRARSRSTSEPSTHRPLISSKGAQAMSATLTDSPPTSTAGEPESPLARLTPEQIDALGREFDAIHDEVYADLGERDARYIRSTIRLHRQLVLASRVALLFSRRRPSWLAGTAAPSPAKILDDIERGPHLRAA